MFASIQKNKNQLLKKKLGKWIPLYCTLGVAWDIYFKWAYVICAKNNQKNNKK